MKQIRIPKFSKPIFTCGEKLRFSTPEIVGRYRALQLKCSLLADINCGIGGQAVCFAEECGMVHGVDIDDFSKNRDFFIGHRLSSLTESVCIIFQKNNDFIRFYNLI